MNHECPIDGCTRQLPYHILMCSRHWGMVPPNLKRQVYSAWNGGKGASTTGYLESRSEAVRSVNLLMGGDRPCRKSGQAWDDFALWLINEGCYPDLDKPQQWTLTVGHLDQNPANNRPSNLKAMCAGCHLRHDRAFRQFNRAAKLERKGQLNLLRGN